MSGGASQLSGEVSHLSGGASPFSGGASHLSGGASRSIGGASCSSGSASPVGGSSQDGGIAMDMEGSIKKIAGKLHSIPKKIKLPTQVVLDSKGVVRTDFPFDQISSRHKLWTLTHHTSFPVHPKKKNMEDWIAEQGSTESIATTNTTSGDLSNVSFVFGQTQYGSYSCVHVLETEDMTNQFENSSMIVNVSSRNTTDVDVDGDETKMDGSSDVTNDAGGVDVTNNNNNMSSESTLGLAELFLSTPNAIVPKSSLNDFQVDAYRSGDSMTIGTVPESFLDELQGDADGSSDVTVTEKLTGINCTVQVDQSALLVGGDG